MYQGLRESWDDTNGYPLAACCQLKGNTFEVALASFWGPMKTWVYVDGFNLYYEALRGTTYKWLDPVRLTAILLPQGHLDQGWQAKNHGYLNRSGSRTGDSSLLESVKL